MSTTPEAHPPIRPDRRMPRFVRYAGNVAATALAVVTIVPFVEALRETGVYELKDKPALKDKVRTVKAHQRDLIGIAEDALSPKGSVEASPYSRVKVQTLRRTIKKEGTSDKLVPPLVTHKEFENGGSFTALNFSSEPSREATVKALDNTIKATQKTKLDGRGLDAIYDRYRFELADEQTMAAHREEAAIAIGMTKVAKKLDETYEGKPVLNKVGYPDDIEESAGLMFIDVEPGPLRTADYPSDNSNYGMPTILPNTLNEAMHQLPGSPQSGEIPLINAHR